MRFLLVSLSVVVAHLEFGTASQAQKLDLKDPATIAAGRTLFQQKQCAYCHGADGNGGIRLAGRDDLDAAGVFQTITEGRSTGVRRMPSWSGILTEDEIWQAVAYVMSLAATVPSK
jgi:mono/diheme cytochrome c family protein